LIAARSKLAIIPQDPFLFSGTVRDNVDPQQLRSDTEITDAIERCRLVQTVSRLGGLHGLIAEGGRMLSAGERQLVCLARALLSQTQVSYQFFSTGIYCIFTACHRASFATAVYATASPSVCPSHSSIVSKQGKTEGCGLYPPSVSSFLWPRMVDVQVKFECKDVDPL